MFLEVYLEMRVTQYPYPSNPPCGGAVAEVRRDVFVGDEWRGDAAAEARGFWQGDGAAATAANSLSISRGGGGGGW